MKKSNWLPSLLSWDIKFALLMWGNVFAQSKEDLAKADELATKAIELIDDSKYEEGILLLKKADKLDPKNSTYQYEIAYVLYAQQKYKEANKVLESIINKKDVTDVYYQLLGNTYDILGDSGKAMDTYNEGINKFPDAGNLYLEQGVIYMGQERYDEALSIFEQGVAAEPAYSSNYFWLAKLYTATNYPVYSAIYGEISINLERNSKRTRQISELLYKVYKEAVIFTDTSVQMKFVKENVLTMDDLELMKKGLMPFPMEFGITMGVGAALTQKKFDLAYINNMRHGFLTFWYQKGNDKNFPNALIDMWKTLADKGHFTAYNYWLSSKGTLMPPRLGKRPTKPNTMCL